MANEVRQPLSFWGTVGAVATSGVILTGASLLLTFIVGGAVVRRQVTEAMKEPLPPGNG